MSYYFFSLTTDMNRDSQNPRVPAAQRGMGNERGVRAFGSGRLSESIPRPIRHQSMAALKEGDQWQMWEFIRI